MMTPAAVTKKNENIKMSSSKSSGNIQKKEDEPDRSVSNSQFSSVTVNELAMKVRKSELLFRVSTRQAYMGRRIEKSS